MTLLLVLLSIVLLAAVSAVLVVQRLIHICQPNEVLVFYGPNRRVGQRRVGYRLVQGGRGVRVPLFEQVARMDLTNMAIAVKVEGAYSKGGIPLNVESVANVKVASDEQTLANAIERFLFWSREDIIRVAKETLEGNLRGVLATLTPEEVNQDRVKFAQSLLHEADHDLRRLGLTLDTLKIQNVSDDKGYLDSIGRKQTADLQMKSRLAEADNRAMALERAAKNHEEKSIAKLAADYAIAQADVQRRVVDAQTKKLALVAEERSLVAAEVAKEQAALPVQAARIEQVRRRLEADLIRPAEARLGQLREQARGEAARLIEEGRATAQSLEELSRTWTAAGDSARQVFLAQKLSSLVEKMVGTVGHAPISKVTVIDARLAESNGGLAAKAAVASEQLKHTLGVDVPGLLARLGPSPSTDKPAKS